MTRPAILSKLRGVQKASTDWRAFCPSREDRLSAWIDLLLAVEEAA